MFLEDHLVIDGLSEELDHGLADFISFIVDHIFKHKDSHRRTGKPADGGVLFVIFEKVLFFVQPQPVFSLILSERLLVPVFTDEGEASSENDKTILLGSEHQHFKYAFVQVVVVDYSSADDNIVRVVEIAFEALEVEDVVLVDLSVDLLFVSLFDHARRDVESINLLKPFLSEGRTDQAGPAAEIEDSASGFVEASLSDVLFGHLCNLLRIRVA